MGFMEKMRSSTAPILWVLVIAFGLLFMLQDTQVFDAVLAGPRTMGEVNGKPVTSEQFNQRLNAFTEQHRQQTGNPPSREQLANYQDVVWDQLVVELALQSQMEELGIEVTDQEIRDAVFGDDPDPIIRQYFSLPDGSIDRGSLRAFVEAPEAAGDWIIIENQIRERRQQEKINQYVQSSIFISDREIEQEYLKTNTRANISYVRFPYSEVSDDEITVSDSDLRSYHKNNGNQFEQDKTWSFRYVTFSKLPTEADTSRTLEMMTNMRESFAMAENDSLFLLDNFSTTEYNGSFRPATEVGRAYYDVFDMETDEVSEAVIDGNQAVIYKKTGERRGSETFVRARRIQLNFNDSNKDQKRAEANEIVSDIRGGADFSDFLSQSNDRTSAAQNGDLGFLSREDFDNAVSNPLFRANTGALVGPIEYEGAYHVFQVVEKTNTEVSFVALGRLIEADPSLTVQSQQIVADDFREFAVLDGFEEEAARNEYVVQEATATEGSPFIAGLGESRITMRALNRLNKEDISEVLELDDMFVVLQLDEVREKGVRPLSDVESLVEAAVKQRKRKDILTQRVRSEYTGLESLDAIAEAADKQVQSAANVRMNSTNISGGGREPGFIGAVFGAEVEQLKGPIVGENAVFFFVVNERQEADLESLSSAERDRIRTRLQQQKTRVFTENLVDELKESADIKDHRQALGMMQ